MVELAEMGLILQTISVMSAATAAVIGVRSYINSNKRAQETRDRELETRQAQMFMNIYDKNSSIEFSKANEKIVWTPWKTFEEYSKLWENPEFNEAAMLVANTYEGVGVLVKENLMDIKLVALLMGGKVRQYSEKIMPILEDGRRSMGYRRWLSETEYLYNELVRYIGQHPELDTRFERVPHFHAE